MCENLDVEIKKLENSKIPNCFNCNWISLRYKSFFSKCGNNKDIIITYCTYLTKKVSSHLDVENYKNYKCVCYKKKIQKNNDKR